MKRVIKKLSLPNKFLVFYQGYERDRMFLDFNPIIDRYKLAGIYILLHFQAKPKGLRTWGIYDSLTQNYYSSERFLLPERNYRTKFLQIDENLHRTVPTAVVYIRDLAAKELFFGDK